MLIVEVLTVLEWKVEEQPLLPLLEAEIELAIHRPIGDGARLLVGGEGAGRTAIEIARELIEAQQQGERALGAVLPSR